MLRLSSSRLELGNSTIPTVYKIIFQFLEKFGIHPLTDPRFTNVISLLKATKHDEAEEQINDSSQFPETLEIEEFYRYVCKCIECRLGILNIHNLIFRISSLFTISSFWNYVVLSVGIETINEVIFEENLLIRLHLRQFVTIHSKTPLYIFPGVSDRTSHFLTRYLLATWSFQSGCPLLLSARKYTINCLTTTREKLVLKESM